jgi:hypothetical protein
MIEMKQDPDGVFRSDGEDIPLPYGLPNDPQEPYVAIVAPNIDKISASAFTPRTVAGRRTKRGLLAFAASVGGSLLLIGLIVGVQSVMRLFGAE